MTLETTEDAVLGGRLRLRQPKRGHRVGHDAILLAAATPARSGEQVIELGAGVGAAGLALAQRVEGVSITLVEIDEMLAALAVENAASNGLAERTRVVALDVTSPMRSFATAGLEQGRFARVLMNPPFNDAANASPDAGKRRAHVAAPATLSLWVRRAGALLRASGTLTLIWRADGLADVLDALRGTFGGIAVLPVHPRPDAAAIRVIVHAVKGSRTPMSVLPGLMLNDAEGRPGVVAEAILRNGAHLPLAANRRG